TVFRDPRESRVEVEIVGRLMALLGDSAFLHGVKGVGEGGSGRAFRTIPPGSNPLFVVGKGSQASLEAIGLWIVTARSPSHSVPVAGRPRPEFHIAVA
ncbi:hypothetical protein EN866_33105, partial [Mesorhizobium sp. M2D.F.Ca.ET.223.01.1.1]